MADDRFERLLGPFLLGELAGQEERELERHLEGCHECRGELDRLRQTHNLLRRHADLQPSATLKEQVLSYVGSETHARTIGRWWFWTSVAAALLVAAVLSVVIFRTFTDDPVSDVALTATSQAPEAGGHIQVDDAGENLQVTLEVWGMPELEEGEYYEMWYYAEGDGRISCGTFRTGPEGEATVNLTAPAGARDYPEIEVTREPDDGNPRSSDAEVLEGELRGT